MSGGPVKDDNLTTPTREITLVVHAAITASKNLIDFFGAVHVGTLITICN